LFIIINHFSSEPNVASKNFKWSFINIAFNSLNPKVIAQKQLEIPLFDSGVSNKKNALHSSFLRNLLGNKNEKLHGVRGCNMSFWKNDLRLVNGFNEAFVGWGREDSELVLRLFHSGIKRVDLRFSAIAYHLYHPENSRSDLSKNDEELERAKNEKRKFCEKGLNQYET
jgi:GT2 family glycosyltransferase